MLIQLSCEALKFFVMKMSVLKVRLAQEFLQTDQLKVNDFFLKNEIIKVNSHLIEGEECFWSVIAFYEDKTLVKESKPVKYSLNSNDELSDDEIKILDSLRLWRNARSKEQRLPSYCIATNKELASIAKYKPICKQDLKEIKGFGKHKIENYGSEIIEILAGV